jgi:hypothetical protein
VRFSFSYYFTFIIFLRHIDYSLKFSNFEYMELLCQVNFMTYFVIQATSSLTMKVSTAVNQSTNLEDFFYFNSCAFLIISLLPI